MVNSFANYIMFREGKENFEQPHVISADPPMKLPEEITRLAEIFKKGKEVSIGKEVDPKGGEKDITLKSRKLFVVGDAVSSYLLNRTPKKIELVTDAHPDEVIKICRKAIPPVHVMKTDDKNGSVKVSIDGKTFEIETLKDGENKTEDGSLSLTTELKKDAMRRELTIDALYYDIIGKKIFDFTGGIRHLGTGDVKFIGNANEKIKEDGMRKFRYAHMVNKVPNGKIDQNIKDLIGTNKGQELPPEKIRDSFWSGFEDLHVNAKKYIKTFNDLGMMDIVFPGLELEDDLPDIKTIKTRPIALAFLLKKNPPDVLVDKLNKLKYTDREVKDAVFLINLLRFSPEYVSDYKRELLKTGLTRRQIKDWVKENNLPDSVEQMLDHSFVNYDDYPTENQAKWYDAKNFMKKIEM